MPKKGSMCDQITPEDLKTLPMIELCRKYGIKNHNVLISWCKRKNIALKPHTYQAIYTGKISVKNDESGLYFEHKKQKIKPSDAMFSIRRQMGYDRESFGLLFGKSRRTIERWEQGGTIPQKDMAHIKNMVEERFFDQITGGDKK